MTADSKKQWHTRAAYGAVRAEPPRDLMGLNPSDDVIAWYFNCDLEQPQ